MVETITEDYLSAKKAYSLFQYSAIHIKGGGSKQSSGFNGDGDDHYSLEVCDNDHTGGGLL